MIHILRGHLKFNNRATLVYILLLMIYCITKTFYDYGGRCNNIIYGHMKHPHWDFTYIQRTHYNLKH
jgi:hypothetical protein